MSIFDGIKKKELSLHTVSPWQEKNADSIEQLKMQLEKEKQWAQMAAQNQAMQNIHQHVYGGQQNTGQIWGAQNMPRQAYPFGQLYLNGEPLPVEWRGAEYTGIERSTFNTFWELRFSSKWSGEYIYLHLDLDKHSGDEVNKMAQTFLEVINQRRVG